MSTIQDLDLSANILRSLLWRNSSAVNIQALLQDKQNFYDTDNEGFWVDWIRDVFDLRTANLFGLNVWSIILNLNITIDPVVEPANQSWGFGADRKNFLNGNFSAAAGDLPLSNEDARVVLQLRYYQLTTNANVTAINFILDDVFGEFGISYVVDGLDMTMTYVFTFQLSTTLLAVLEDFDVLPRSSGVGVTITTDLDNTHFGYEGFRKNFGHGNFG